MLLPKKTKEDRAKEKKARKKIKKKVSKKAIKKPTLKKEKERCDRIMSIYIRLRDCLKTTETLDNGYCFTCRKPYSFAELQNGHFVSRAKVPTRMDEDNCNAQCYGCNVIKNGNYIEYTTRLIDERGRNFVDALIEKSKNTVKYKAFDYIDMQQMFVSKIFDMSGMLYKWEKEQGKSYYKWIGK